MASLPNGTAEAPRETTARHGAQASILAYVTSSARPAAQDASVQRPPAADSQQRARAAAQPLRTQTAQRKHTSKKKTSLADTPATHVSEDISVSANEEESDDDANSEDRDFISDGQHDCTGLDQRLCEIDTMQEDSESETELLEQAIQDISGKKCKKLSVEADETVKKKERSK